MIQSRLFYNQAKTWHRPVAGSKRSGLTLIELIVILVNLIALGSLIVPQLDTFAADAEETATRATLTTIANAIDGPGGYAETMRYVQEPDESGLIGGGSGLPWPSSTDIAGGREDHPQLAFLFKKPAGINYNPTVRLGWPGAALSPATATRYEPADSFSTAYGESGATPADLAPLDGWGRPIIIQFPTTTDSFDLRIEFTRLISAGANGTIDTPNDELEPSATDIGDDIVLYLRQENL
jgi:hypothetical protein